ncbi:MAG: hypothetical protein ACI9F2_000013 [Lysobacterales bacterium]|jgi:hypothetical protein
MGYRIENNYKRDSKRYVISRILISNNCLIKTFISMPGTKQQRILKTVIVEL